MNLFLLKLTRFEFWPWKVFYFPLLPYYIYLSIKNGSLAFPGIVNTALKKGGFFYENKKEILLNIPGEFLPKSIYVSSNTLIHDIFEEINLQKLEYPIIAKPLREQRGKNVAILNSEDELLNYYVTINKDFVIQEFIDYPIELAILYSRMPNEKKGIVSSITKKDFLSVTGNGQDSIENILKANPRALLIWDDLQQNVKIDWKRILKKGEKQIIEKIGNHCRGTIFFDAHEIDKQKTAFAMDKILCDFEGFNYGRFDLKVKSTEDLYNAENIKVLELNGVNADAAHIFDPNYKLLKAYKDVAWHWNRLSQIAEFNRQIGQPHVSFSELWKRIN